MEQQHTACQRKLIAIARSFRTAMVTTRQSDGAMHTRPMSIAKVDDNGDLWFATGANSVKLNEIDNDSTTGVVMQRGLRFAAFTGIADSRFDRALARQLWSETWRPWFPGGPSDTELKLMCVHVKHGEFWDLTGVRGVRYVMEAVRCSLARTRMSDEPDDDRHGIATFAPA